MLANHPNSQWKDPWAPVYRVPGMSYYISRGIFLKLLKQTQNGMLLRSTEVDVVMNPEGGRNASIYIGYKYTWSSPIKIMTRDSTKIMQDSTLDAACFLSRACSVLYRMTTTVHYSP